jgi:hypothetical protein
MQPKVYFAALIALAAGSDALAVGSSADIRIIDRTTGVELLPHFHHGEYWVAGTPGTTYAIMINNRLGERVLAVTSVDGVNVISGETANWDQNGYVFNAFESYEVDGWRKSDTEVAAFTFTASPNSYAERTGRPANVGVVGVAVFRERPPLPPLTSAPAPSMSPAAAPTREAGVPLPAASPADEAQEPSRLAATTPEPKLGTGHGTRENSYVRHVDFMRLQSHPNEIIRIRYDSLDNLIAMGIVERPHPDTNKVEPFPASPHSEYVPDPPGEGAGDLR